MNELTKTNQNMEIVDYKETAIDYLKGMGMDLPQKYANQFIEICKAYGLNPFKRECYAVGYGENWNIITGYEVYLKRAERTGKLDGWVCIVEGQGQNMIAKLTIHRKDWSHPFHHFVLYNEAVQRKRDGSVNSMWAKQGSFMLRKVCIAQGFRLCFPDELGGMPYISDELPEIEKNITNEAALSKVFDTCFERQNADYVEVQQNYQNQTSQSDEHNPQEVSNKFADLLQKYQNQLDNHYATAYEAFQTGSDNEMVSMYNRCVSYLAKKGIKVA